MSEVYHQQVETPLPANDQRSVTIFRLFCFLF
jgi:hypothetical protein